MWFASCFLAVSGADMWAVWGYGKLRKRTGLVLRVPEFSFPSLTMFCFHDNLQCSLTPSSHVPFAPAPHSPAAGLSSGRLTEHRTHMFHFLLAPGVPCTAVAWWPAPCQVLSLRWQQRTLPLCSEFFWCLGLVTRMLTRTVCEPVLGLCG